MKEAQLYNQLEGRKVHCQLCAHGCKIQDGKFGFCAVRQNIKGILYTHNYGKLVAVNVDPVEKKPLYHFFQEQKLFLLPVPGVIFVVGFAKTGRFPSLTLLTRVRVRILALKMS